MSQSKDDRNVRSRDQAEADAEPRKNASAEGRTERGRKQINARRFFNGPHFIDKSLHARGAPEISADDLALHILGILIRPIFQRQGACLEVGSRRCGKTDRVHRDRKTVLVRRRDPGIRKAQLHLPVQRELGKEYLRAAVEGDAHPGIPPAAHRLRFAHHDDAVRREKSGDKIILVAFLGQVVFLGNRAGFFNIPEGRRGAVLDGKRAAQAHLAVQALRQHVRIFHAVRRHIVVPECGRKTKLRKMERAELLDHGPHQGLHTRKRADVLAFKNVLEREDPFCRVPQISGRAVQRHAAPFGILQRDIHERDRVGREREIPEFFVLSVDHVVERDRHLLGVKHRLSFAEHRLERGAEIRQIFNIRRDK